MSFLDIFGILWIFMELKLSIQSSDIFSKFHQNLKVATAGVNHRICEAWIHSIRFMMGHNQQELIARKNRWICGWHETDPKDDGNSWEFWHKGCLPPWLIWVSYSPSKVTWVALASRFTAHESNAQAVWLWLLAKKMPPLTMASSLVKSKNNKKPPRTSMGSLGVPSLRLSRLPD